MNCFLYARKSTESEDRQILSIEAQIKELKTVALNRGLKIVEIFSEAKSAKAPGQPVFNKMMEEVFQSGGINILCWKLDRLARNPVDGGQLIWAIEKKGVNEIVTPHRSFRNNGDDKFWMQLEFGMAKKYIDDLSDNVKRGNRAKLGKGILPGKAPLGYLNGKETKTIKKDPVRFHLVRRIWDTVLSGDYNIKALLRSASEDWGLTTPQCKTPGGKPLTQSSLYKLLSNPFYYGVIRRKSDFYPGNHEPMITKAEFDKVQRILKRHEKTCSKTKQFAYTALIRCGECGSMITAEHKINRYGYHYTYYRCTKHKGGIENACKQKYVRAEELEKQIVALLEKFNISEKFLAWIGKQVEKTKSNDEILRTEMKKSLSKSLEDCKTKNKVVVAAVRNKFRNSISKRKIIELIENTGLENVRNQLRWFPYRDNSWARNGPVAAFVSYCNQEMGEPVNMTAKSETKEATQNSPKSISNMSENIFIEQQQNIIERRKRYLESEKYDSLKMEISEKVFSDSPVASGIFKSCFISEIRVERTKRIIVIDTPNPFCRDWLKKGYEEKILKFLKQKSERFERLDFVSLNQ